MAAGKPQESFGNAVILPCEPSQFREFIADLLGQPQTVERALYGRFEVDRANIENLFHLIDQRISSQNDGHLRRSASHAERRSASRSGAEKICSL